MQRAQQTAPGQHGWRCGELLIDPQRRLLLRAGVAVEVEERALDLIVLLAAHHDRAVDRRELTVALWGARPVGDATLRQVVYKARQALGDDGRRQAVIRTLHGRSLRWVAPLETVIDDRHGGAPAVQPALPSALPARSAKRRLSLTSVATRSFIAIALLAAVAGVLLLVRVPTGEPSPLVAVAPIENATGDRALDWTQNGLPGLLSSLLEDAGVSAADPHIVDQAWNEAGSAAAAREEHVRAATGAVVVIGGRLRRVGAGYELELRLHSPQRDSSEISTSGDRPGALAAQAVPRVRQALAVNAMASGEHHLPAESGTDRWAARPPLATR